jgi:hypothetical protein
MEWPVEANKPCSNSEMANTDRRKLLAPPLTSFSFSVAFSVSGNVMTRTVFRIFGFRHLVLGTKTTYLVEEEVARRLLFRQMPAYLLKCEDRDCWTADPSRFCSSQVGC